MEVNSPNIEKPDQRACFLEDDHHGMSYRCSFCKKGFSNAQALGGHMNIHRRDRAKLREFSGETLTLMESGQKNSSENDNSQESLSPDRSHEKSCHHKRIRVSSMEEEEEEEDDHDHDHGKEVMQLPLFVYTPAINKRGKFKKTVVKGHQEFQPLSLSVYRKKMKTDADKHAEKGKMGLDLELRLGPEP